MAKGLRASVRKENKAKLRATVFGPAEDARTARLSAKLQELVSRPKEAEMMDVNIVDSSVNNNASDADKDMDIDEGAGANASEGKNSGKIQKRNRKKRPSKITFKPHPGKIKRMAKK